MKYEEGTNSSLRQPSETFLSLPSLLIVFCLNLFACYFAVLSVSVFVFRDRCVKKPNSLYPCVLKFTITILLLLLLPFPLSICVYYFSFQDCWDLQRGCLISQLLALPFETHVHQQGVYSDNPYSSLCAGAGGQVGRRPVQQRAVRHSHRPQRGALSGVGHTC